MSVMDEATSVSESSDPPSLTLVQLPLSAKQILEVTARCLREEGYDATTIRRIAGRLDCAVGSIYRYYTDKRELLGAVTHAAFEPAALVIEAGGSVEDSAALYHQIAMAEPALYRLMFWITSLGEGAPSAPPGGAVMSAVGVAKAPRIVERIIAGWGKRLGDEAAARSAWVTLHGCVMLGVEREASLEAVRASVNHGSRSVTAVREVGVLREPQRIATAVEVPEAVAEPVVLIKKPARRTRPAAAARVVEVEHAEDVVLL